MRRTVLFLALLLTLSMLSVQAGANSLPVLLVSVGQSDEIAMVRQLCVLGRIVHTVERLATDKDLTSADGKPKYSAVVVVVGGSAKGLGAAGINKDQELARGQALLERARTLKLNIVLMHIGGEERRGELSDAFIRGTVGYASSMIVLASGDKDGIFEASAKSRNIPIHKVTRISDALDPLKRALGIQ